MISSLFDYYIVQDELINRGKQVIGSIEYQVFEHPIFGDLRYIIVGDKCALLIEGTDNSIETHAVLNSITPNQDMWNNNDDSLMFLGIALIIVLGVIIFLAKRPPGYEIPTKELVKNKLNPWKLDKFWKRFIYFLGLTGVFSIWGLLYAAWWLGEKRNHVFDKVERLKPGTEIATNTQKLLVVLGWIRTATIVIIVVALVLISVMGWS